MIAHCNQVRGRGLMTLHVVFHRAALWLCYGLLKGDTSIILVNGIGAALQSSYIVVFYQYVESKVTSVCVYVCMCVCTCVCVPAVQ